MDKHEYQTSTHLVSWYVIGNIIPIVLITTTPKGSPLRYLAIACMLWIITQIQNPMHSPIYLAVWSSWGCVILVFSALNHLLIKPKDKNDFIDANGKPKGFFSRLNDATRLITSMRAVNTPQQAKNTPSWPAYYAEKDGKISRTRFLTREISIGLWQYLLLDVCTFVTLKDAMERKESGKNVVFGTDWDFPIEQWVELIILNILGFFVLGRTVISSLYRLSAIVCVSTGLGSVSDFPPPFNSMSDAYTLRNFWGCVFLFISCLAAMLTSDSKFWHQMIRLPLTGVSNFISRDLLRLPKPSLIERYFNIFLVFFFSGLIHLLANPAQSISLRQSGAMSFFLSFVVGYMIEDGVESLWKQIRGPLSTGSPSLWEKAVGYCWVFGWVGVSVTFYFGPQMGRPECTGILVPFSFLDLFGIPVVSALLVVGGIVLKLKFKVEI